MTAAENYSAISDRSTSSISWIGRTKIRHNSSPDAPQQPPARLGIQPAHAYYGPVGGESPIRYLHEAAQRIERGECSVAAICGAEAQSTATKAERAGVDLPWTPFARDVEEPKRGAAFQKPMAVKLGVFRPVTVYPFYEAATSAH